MKKFVTIFITLCLISNKIFACDLSKLPFDKPIDNLINDFKLDDKTNRSLRNIKLSQNGTAWLKAKQICKEFSPNTSLALDYIKNKLTQVRFKQINQNDTSLFYNIFESNYGKPDNKYFLDKKKTYFRSNWIKKDDFLIIYANYTQDKKHIEYAEITSHYKDGNRKFKNTKKPQKNLTPKKGNQP